MLFQLLLFLALLSPAFAEFLNPAQGGAQSIWTIGDIQSIKYAAQFQHYTIAIWQQNSQVPAAAMGPIIYEAITKEGETEGSFDWTVQLYNFDLKESSVFFFWMFEGDSSSQGNISLPDTSSPYFQIIIKPPPSSSSSASSSPTSSASTSSRASATSQRVTVATITASSEASKTSKTDTVPVYITTTTASTANSRLPLVVSTTNNSAASSTVSYAPSTSNAPSPDSSDVANSRVKVGIAIGVAVAVLASIVASLILWYRLKRKKKQEAAPVRPKISHPLGLLSLDPYKRSMPFSRNGSESCEGLNKDGSFNQLAVLLPPLPAARPHSPVPAELDSLENSKPAEMV